MLRTNVGHSKQQSPSLGADHVQGTAAFSKFMTVLQTISETPGELDVARLAKLLPYSRGTLYRIIAALSREGLITENKATGTFQLGHRLISLASKSWEGSDLRSVAHGHIAALRDSSGETVHLAVPSGREMVYIDKLESPRSVRMTSRIGTRVNLHSTSVGKAYLAALSPEASEKILKGLQLQRRTKNTIIRIKDLQAEIRETRRRGFSIDQEENEIEIHCFGAAILGRDGSPVGCVSVSIPNYRLDQSAAKKYVVDLMSTVKIISQSLSTLV
jgi:DNA-binding IclR family transcriptional regulator